MNTAFFVNYEDIIIFCIFIIIAILICKLTECIKNKFKF